MGQGGGGPYSGGITYSGGNGDTADGAPDDLYIRAEDIDLGFSVNGTAVPEPGTFAMFGLTGCSVLHPQKTTETVDFEEDDPLRKVYLLGMNGFLSHIGDRFMRRWFRST